MKVKELIELLKEEDPEKIVIMQKDSEGNGYSPLSGVDGNAVYLADSTWSGTAYDIEWSAGDAGMEEEDWEQFKKDTPDCVIVFPIN